MALFDWARRDTLKDQWKLSKFSHAQPRVDTNRKRFSFGNTENEQKQEENNNQSQMAESVKV